MLSTTSILFAASLLVAGVHADVLPSEPSPSSPPFPEGSDCSISWTGDTNVTTQAIWKSMNIQLMTGSNFDMKHISTVATNQDGTVSGNFKYPCPAVVPNAAIYFYQFTSATSKTPMWTTRFTIAGPDGDVEDAPNPTQPNGGAPVPWGIGALEDPSKAVAPPSYLAGGAPAGTAGATTAGSTGPGTVGATTPAGTTPRTTPPTTPTPSTSKPAPSATQSVAGNNNGAGALRVDLKSPLVVLGGCAMAFAVLL